jgi:hypothetical protein
MKLFIYWLARISVLSFVMMAGLMEARAESWDPQNDPSAFDLSHNYDYKLVDLPAQSTLKTLPWSETYWPSRRGSINIRWNTPDQDGFNFTPTTLAQAKTMTPDQLKQLSPSEKYDLFMGHYDYPLWTEVKRYADPTADPYSGLCDGWSVAAVQYAEPNAVTLPNPDGILIPFGSSDVKALMTFASEFHFRRHTIQAGISGTGMNAGAMHVILANQIGLKQSGFVTERQPDNEDWNQPVYGYESQMLGSSVSNIPGAHGVLVHTVLHYTEDLDLSYFAPVTGTSNFHSNKIVMDYVLDLDANENIIGGTWSTGSDRPGYFWNATNHLTFTGTMSGLNQIYQPVP